MGQSEIIAIIRTLDGCRPDPDSLAVASDHDRIYRGLIASITAGGYDPDRVPVVISHSITS